VKAIWALLFLGFRDLASDYAAARPVEPGGSRMSSYEEIKPRELKPALLELDGISRATVEAHYKLYGGYVAKRNEILGRLGGVDLGSANQVYSEVRALKVDLSFALGGIKNHEIYFEHLGGGGGDPTSARAARGRRT
jgi:superoxide dismutase, Fe-Mn family